MISYEDIKIKHLVKSIKTGLNPRSNFVLGEGDNYYVTTKNLDGLNVVLDDRCDNVTDNALRKINARSDLRTHDILFSGIGTIGRTAIVEETPKNWNISESLYSLRPNERVYYKYLYYVLNGPKMEDYYLHYQTGSAQKGLRQEDLKNFKATIFNFEYQKRLVDYLDKKVSAIDSLIEKEEKAVEELKEYSLSLIEKVTTHGLTKEPLHKTLCKWIDGVPEKWIVSKSLYVLSMPITDGPHETLNLIEDGIPFISAEAIKNNKIDFDLRRGNISDNDYRMCCQKYIPKLNDVYMIKSGATTGNVAMVEDNRIFTIWSPLAVYRANTQKILPRFVFYALRSKYYKNQVEDGWSFGTQQNIGMRVLEKLYIAYPVSLKEQQEIVDYLDKKCEAIDKLLELKEDKIEKLKEYKKSLIYECVTGRRQINA